MDWWTAGVVLMLGSIYCFGHKKPEVAWVLLVLSLGCVVVLWK